MSQSQHSPYSSPASTSSSSTTTHSKELALDEREFELFLEGCRQIDDYRSEQAVFVAFVAGRLGLRSGEIAHMREDWIDWRRRMIVIPRQQDCQKGKDGGPCGYCRQHAEQFADYNQYSIEEARLELIQQGTLLGQMPPELHSELRAVHEAATDGEISDEEYQEFVADVVATAGIEDAWERLDDRAHDLVDECDVTVEEALERSWSAKTDAAAREVPFDHDPRCELIIERFFDVYNAWPHSKSTINRRVDLALELAPELEKDDTTPHGLRATAATACAARGLDILPMQSLFGWADISTARNYLQTSGANTSRALHEIHSR